jgi:hypothetical protein
LTRSSRAATSLFYFCPSESLSKGADCVTLAVCRLEPNLSMMHLNSAARRQAVSIAVIVALGWTLAAWPARSVAAPLAQDRIAAITAPTDGQELQGAVTITGSANHPEFDRFELAFGPEPNPNDAWQVFATSKQPAANAALGVWDTGSVGDGMYSLRLRVVRKDSNYDEVFVRGLHVGNQQPLSTPTSSVPQATFPPEPTTDIATAVPGVEPTARSVPTVLVEQPPTSLPAAVAPGATPTPARGTGSSGSAAFVDLGPIASTCLSGAILAGFAFALLGVIQLARALYKSYLRFRYKKSHAHADSHATPPAADRQ